MKRILYFDCFSGISGDMTLGALIDLGLSPEAVEAELAKLQLPGYQLRIEKTKRYSISGTDVDVILEDSSTASGGHHHSQDDHEHGHDHSHHHSHEQADGGHHSHEHAEGSSHAETAHHHDHSHTHEHTHDHDHSHGHDHGHSHEHAEDDNHHHHTHERNLADITELIESSAVSLKAKALALAVFQEIARAEGKVHGMAPEEVHFHEVGAVDSIVDITGAAICLDMLAVDEVHCSPVQDGHGFVTCQHGRLPVPVPAVAEMMSESHIRLLPGDLEGELVTPTGYGILKLSCGKCGPMPSMKIEKTGYGFGKKDTGSLNALRVFLGTADDDENISDEKDQLLVAEATLDDERGEILGYLMERLMEEGALDAYFTPVFMKKNRPGVNVTFLCQKVDLDKLGGILLAETSTIGFRYYPVKRTILHRDILTKETALGPVRFKVSGSGSEKTVKPEFEDCQAIAREKKLPLRAVMQQALSSFEEK